MNVEFKLFQYFLVIFSHNEHSIVALLVEHNVLRDDLNSAVPFAFAKLMFAFSLITNELFHFCQ